MNVNKRSKIEFFLIINADNNKIQTSNENNLQYLFVLFSINNWCSKKS